MRKSDYEVILFDLGGVLVELSGLPTMRAWIGDEISDEMLWSNWLKSPSVRNFERGLISADEFGTSIVREMQLPVTADQFLWNFRTWPLGVFAGGIDLLKQLQTNYRLSCLSNTNSLHWPRLMDEMDLADYFQDKFASHETGSIKPDREVFELVIKRLGVEPSRILFFDDLQACVDSAKASGMDAHRVQGVQGTRQTLHDLGILLNPPIA